MAGSDDNDYYNYTPSITAATILTVIFGLLTAIHGYQLFRTRTWYFLAFWAGGICETVGYATRIWSASEKPDYTRGPYVISQVTVLVAPSLLAASMYMELGRIIRLTDGHRYAIIRVTWLTKIFVMGDLVAFFAQAAGGAMLASDDKDTSDSGKTVLQIGLIVQILFFGLFVITSVLFHFRITRHPTEKIQKHTIPWRKHLINIYVCSIMVLIRCIFRFIEYSGGKDGYLMSTEWVIYVFDAALMVIVMAAFVVIHPSEVKALLKGSGLAMRKVVLTKQMSLSMPMEEVSGTYQLV